MIEFHLEVCCKRYGNPRCFPKCLECVGFSRSLKSRLGLVKELEK